MNQLMWMQLHCWNHPTFLVSQLYFSAVASNLSFLTKSMSCRDKEIGLLNNSFNSWDLILETSHYKNTSLKLSHGINAKDLNTEQSLRSSIKGENMGHIRLSCKNWLVSIFFYAPVTSSPLLRKRVKILKFL